MISQIKQVGGRVFDRILSDKNIDAFNGAQGRILYILWQKEDVPIVELSQKTGLAKNTLTSMLGRMEEAGLIARKSGKTDRRQSLITLTEKARELEGKYRAVSDLMNSFFYEGFTEEETKQMDGLLERILENLEKSERSFKSSGR